MTATFERCTGPADICERFRVREGANRYVSVGVKREKTGRPVLALRNMEADGDGERVLAEVEILEPRTAVELAGLALECAEVLWVRRATVVDPSAIGCAEPEAAVEHDGAPQACLRARAILIDCENLDATLAGLLGKAPTRETRPSWARVLEYFGGAEAQLIPIAVLNFSRTQPEGFARYLEDIGFEVTRLTAGPERKVVDEAIKRTLAVLADYAVDLTLVSHDGDFAVDLQRFADGVRDVVICGFRERVSSRYASLIQSGRVRVLDIVDDVGAFATPPPRRKRQGAVGLDDWNPATLLDRYHLTPRA